MTDAPQDSGRLTTNSGDYLLWEPVGEENIRIIAVGTQDGEPASTAMEVAPEEILAFSSWLMIAAVERTRGVPDDMKLMILPLLKLLASQISGQLPE